MSNLSTVNQSRNQQKKIFRLSSLAQGLLLASWSLTIDLWVPLRGVLPGFSLPQNRDILTSSEPPSNSCSDFCSFLSFLEKSSVFTLVFCIPLLFHQIYIMAPIWYDIFSRIVSLPLPIETVKPLSSRPPDPLPLKQIFLISPQSSN